MTEKISAGYFDSNRGEPIYVGDVYREEGAMIPFHKVIKDPEKGFMVEHVGTTEKFLLKDDAKNLVKKTYLGNVFDTPDWNELTSVKKSDEPESIKAPEDDLPENTPEDVKAFLNGESEELPEGTEVISQEEAEELEKQAKEIEKTNEDNSSEVVSKTENTTTDAVELVNNGTVVMDMSNEEIEPESDAVVSAEATTGPTDSPESETADQAEEKTEEKQEEAKATPEVITNTKEEKNLLEKRNDYQRHIDALKRKNDELETEAVRYENLASTLTFEPFVELKMLTSNAVQDYAKKQDIKECEKHLKNYKTIDSIESLLKEYEDMAEKNRANIELNNKDIDNYEIKLTEINDKLRAFQTKLPLDSVTNTEDKPAEEIKSDDKQPESESPDDKTTTESDKKAENETNSEIVENSETDSENKQESEPESELLNDEEIPF